MRLRDFVFFFFPPDSGCDHCPRLRGIREGRRKSSASSAPPPDDLTEGNPSRGVSSRISGTETGFFSRVRGSSGLGRREKLNQIRRKIATGYYSSSGHLEELADVLMEKIDFFSPAEDPGAHGIDDE